MSDLACATAQCRYGLLRLTASGQGLRALAFDAEGASARPVPAANGTEGDRHGQPPLGIWTQAVLNWIDAPQIDLDAPLDMQGTPFQRQVWAALREIELGRTATYAEIAARIGRPKAAVAVGAACARNPLALVVPCHRVVNSQGGLTGYRWGLKRKAAILQYERAQAGLGPASLFP